MDLKTLYKISYGLYVVSSKYEDKMNGQIANTVFQTTSDPPTIAVCLNKKNLTHEIIQKSNVFTVSILAKDAPLNFIGDFGFKTGRETDKFKDVKYKIGVTGAPIVLDNAVGYLEAEVINSLDVGTHTIFIGKIVEAQTLSTTEPMTYAYYHEIKRGVSPPTAPTYIKEEKPTKPLVFQKYKCTICGYIYDPEKGDPDSGIKPGTPFEELPENWVCPICGADKSAFEKI
ncbi:MAG: flavin reductase [Candidatus Hadarchaeum sp.]|uniref:rubredoxin n=1 Tax=Candidatus Hadarchaeum sp. TaxID=2883567 RepID=UPI003173F333